MWKYLLLATLIVGAFIYDPKITIFAGMGIVVIIVIVILIPKKKNTEMLPWMRSGQEICSTKNPDQSVRIFLLLFRGRRGIIWPLQGRNLIVSLLISMKLTLALWIRQWFYAGVTFFGTVLFLSVSYGLFWGLSSTDKVNSGSGLSADSWNRIIDGVLDLDTKVSNLAFSGGRVGIGAVNPSAKLDVAGDIKATAGGTIGVTKINGTWGSKTTNIPTGSLTYIGDNITLTPGNWLVHYENFYDYDGSISFTAWSYNHPEISSNTNDSGRISYGNLNGCTLLYCPIYQTYQVSVANTATYYILHGIAGYWGTHVRIRGNQFGNFYAIKTN